MLESEWLASEDPRAMLSEVRQYDNGEPFYNSMSDRKLKLFVGAAACAECRRLAPPGDADAALYVAGASCGTRAGKAALLRDIVGNPWRPVTLPLVDGRLGFYCEGAFFREIVGGTRASQVSAASDMVCPWLTPTVLALARAAYEERLPGGRRKCPCGADYSPLKRDRLPLLSACLKCHREGGFWADPGVPPGLLDPTRLAVLADALEDAGCASEELLRHLRGEERCWNVPFDRDDAGFHGGHCGICDGSGWAPLRSPHVRGCWAIDILLGRE